MNRRQLLQSAAALALPGVSFAQSSYPHLHCIGFDACKARGNDDKVNGRV